MARTRRGNAGERQVLKEDAKLFPVGDVGGRWKALGGSGRGSVNYGNGRFSPGGGGGGEPE